MRQALLVAAAAAALLVPAALAADHQPQRRPTKADQARARSAALRAADLGAAWKPRSSGSGSQSNPRCSTYDPDQSDLVETGRYESPNFTRSDGSFVSSTTGVFRTATMARTGYTRVAVAALPRCFGELFRKGTGNPSAVKHLRSGPLSFPAYGDRSNAYRLSATYTVQGQTLPFAVDIVLFNKGRYDVAMIFLGIGGPLPGPFERALVARVAARAR